MLSHKPVRDDPLILQQSAKTAIILFIWITVLKETHTLPELFYDITFAKFLFGFKKFNFFAT